MREICNIKDLAEILIKEPSSLETLLILTDEGPKTVEQICKEIIYDTKTSDLLDKLKMLNVIDIKDNVVSITDCGQDIISKIRKKVELGEAEIRPHERKIDGTLTALEIDPEFLELAGFKKCKASKKMDDE